jgi:hypothetical protein
MISELQWQAITVDIIALFLWKYKKRGVTTDKRK